MKELLTSLILGITTILFCLLAASFEKKINTENVKQEIILENKKLKEPLIETLTSNYKVVNNQNGILS